MFNRIRLRPIGAVLGFAAPLIIVAIGVVFQDNISRFLVTPRAPFQTMTPPAPPDYQKQEAWAQWPSEKNEKTADVFYVHSTTYYDKHHWNSPYRHDEAERILQSVARPNEVGPFSEIGAVYAPRYRQATLSAFFTHKYDGIASRLFAYQDVSRAFDFFLQYRDGDRPLFLVGYGQGGLHVQGLLRDYFLGQENETRAHLAGAYVIHQPTTSPYLESLSPYIAACETPGDFRCLVSFIDLEPQFKEEMDRMRARGMIWSETSLVPVKGDQILCVNPLSWTRGEEYISRDFHIGAGSATGIKSGTVPPTVSRAIGAQCSNGILIVDKPDQDFLRRGDWFGAKWKAQPFNLFYHDLAKNAADRLFALETKLFEEAQILDPIDGSTDINVSPINKVPG